MAFVKIKIKQLECKPGEKLIIPNFGKILIANYWLGRVIVFAYAETKGNPDVELTINIHRIGDDKEIETITPPHGYSEYVGTGVQFVVDGDECIMIADIIELPRHHGR